MERLKFSHVDENGDFVCHRYDADGNHLGQPVLSRKKIAHILYITITMIVRDKYIGELGKSGSSQTTTGSSGDFALVAYMNGALVQAVGRINLTAGKQVHVRLDTIGGNALHYWANAENVLMNKIFTNNVADAFGIRQEDIPAYLEMIQRLWPEAPNGI